MAIYIGFVTAPYAAPGIKMAMLFFYSGVMTKDEGQGTILAFVDDQQIYSGKSVTSAVEIKLFRDGLTVISVTTASAVS